MSKTEETTGKTVEVKLTELLKLPRFAGEVGLAHSLVPVGTNPEVTFRILTALRGQLAQIASLAAETLETKAGKASKENVVKWKASAKSATVVETGDNIAARLSRLVKARETFAKACFVDEKSIHIPIDSGIRHEIADWSLRIAAKITEETK